MTAVRVSKVRRRRFPLDIEGLVLAHVARVGGSISGPIRSRKQQLLATCGSGHSFNITPHAIIYSGPWCRRCRNGANNANKRWTNAELQLIADKFAGRCLTSKYLHAHQKLEWACGRGHRFKRSISVLKAKPECPECRKCSGKKEVFEKHEQTVSVVCEGRGGRCIRIIPPGKRRQWYARVACSEGHEWEVSCYALTKQKSWCQQCGIASMVANRSYNKSLGLEPFVQIAKKKVANFFLLDTRTRCLFSSFGAKAVTYSSSELPTRKMGTGVASAAENRPLTHAEQPFKRSKPKPKDAAEGVSTKTTPIRRSC